MSAKPIVLSLCDRTGIMVKPWADAGFDCWIVDMRHKPGFHRGEDGILRIGVDILEFEKWLDANPTKFAIIFAFPPCDHLASSGARWWARKGDGPLAYALALVQCCWRMGGPENEGAPRILENPVGRLSTHWRKPDHSFDPCDYGDPYTKRTCLWTKGGFIMPAKSRVAPSLGSRMHRMSSSWKDQRSATPPGFARAVFEANVARAMEVAQ